ncbi:MAG: helix-turn-helix transcriptional regulator [Deltaproteobacteria bacterium]|nr:helix-turn-helix transcriptional regulator [Deltaproteobacteria bacterium]
MGQDAEVRQPACHGICVKALDGTVLSQNLKCIEICGDMRGQICGKGCMLNRAAHPDFPAVDEGVCHLSGIWSDGHLVDAVLINDGENLTTYLLDKQSTVDRKLFLLSPYGLSDAEKNVTELLLAGRTNREIATALYISMSTVRTHLGNIYKKVPKEIRILFFR